MKRILLIFISSFLLVSCSDKPAAKLIEENDIIIEENHDYDEVSFFQIKWDDIFDQDFDEYFVYFYSLSCSHCEEMKNWVIEKATEEGNLFFVKSSNRDVISKDVKNTIGVGFVGDFSILGYPSMTKIENKIVTKNVAGKTNIQNLFV